MKWLVLDRRWGIRLFVVMSILAVVEVDVAAAEFYVNDGSVEGDRFCDGIGDDARGNGSKAKPYGTLRRAVIAARTGDSVIVDAGTFVQSPVNPPYRLQILLNVMGISPNERAGVDIETEGLKVTGAGPELTILRGGMDVVIAVRADNVTVSGLSISEGKTGVEVSGSNSTLEDLWIDSSDEFGIVLAGADGARLKRCRVTGVGFRGVQLENSFKVAITNCSSMRNGNAGFCLVGSSGNVLTGNVAVGNGTSGFYVQNRSSNNTLRDNVSYGSGLGGFYLFTDSTGNVLEGNTARWNQRGFVSKRTSGNYLVGNVANSNEYAQIQIRGDSKDATLEANEAEVEIVGGASNGSQ
ncbi:MAG: right-handed parallel beta-helix repeat-containing protein [Chthoniobacterales bacterium]